MKKKQINQYLVDKAIDDITNYLVQDHKLGIDQAIDFIYNSDTYQKLVTPQTGLYIQSPAYIYQLLENEYKTGKLE